MWESDLFCGHKANNNAEYLRFYVHDHQTDVVWRVPLDIRGWLLEMQLLPTVKID